jgi:hypothetical protein
MYGLRTKINKRNLKHGTFGRQRLPKVIRLALGEYRAMTVKSDHLRNNAATAAGSCVNGSGWDGLGLGGGGGDGEEVSEGIHWCDCVWCGVVCGLTDVMELF